MFRSTKQYSACWDKNNDQLCMRINHNKILPFQSLTEKSNTGMKKLYIFVPANMCFSTFSLCSFFLLSFATIDHQIRKKKKTSEITGRGTEWSERVTTDYENIYVYVMSVYKNFYLIHILFVFLNIFCLRMRARDFWSIELSMYIVCFLTATDYCFANLFPISYRINE